MLLALTSPEINDRAAAFQESLRSITGAYVPVVRRSVGLNKAAISIEAGGNDEFVRAQSDRGIAEWCLLLSLGPPFSLYVAFDEEWQAVGSAGADWRRFVIADDVQPRRAARPQERFVFGGLRLRFYLQRTDPLGSLRQWLRCEWEPYRCSIPDGAADITREDVLSALEFDALEAAHPHFHFDSVPLTALPRHEFMSQTTEVLAAFGERPAFGGFRSEGFVTSGETDLRHIHLPSSPRWTATPFSADSKPSVESPLPHQMYPSSLAELDNWFGWNVRYFLNQFETAIAR